MRQGHFGEAGRKIGVIGQGTWNIDSGDRASAIAALRRGLDLGMNHIDTAEMYGNAELVIAEAIANRRDDVFLVSKVLPQNASRTATIAACDRSLNRLETDHLDCYLLHWRGHYALEETISAFESLVSAGKILSWGVSNFDETDLEEAVAIAGAGKIRCNQVLYHLKERAIEHAVIPWCEKHGVAVVAYSPFGQERFPAPDSRGGQVLQEIATSYNATPRQVALQFLVRHTSVLAIPKASRPEHAAENAAADDISLTEADIARIDRAFPPGPRPRSLPML